MKTTIEIPDALYRRVKAIAALSGRTVKDLVNEALRKQVDEETKEAGERGWRSVFGRASADEVRRIQSRIDTDLSQIDPADWE